MIFPKWFNGTRVALAAGAGIGALYVGVIITFGFSPQATDVGYQPVQPVPYSHALHAGKLGIDCRYCHVNVEDSAHANIPPTQTCMGCHDKLTFPEDRAWKLKPVKDSFTDGNPIQWIRIHDLPDYAYFNHSAHVRRGVGCVECHGRVDRMEVVYQDQPLSMSWCLDCHRKPDARLRDPLKDRITDMEWAPPKGEDRATYGARVRKEYNIQPSQDCSTCHR
jgi:hypothetical protein